MTALKESQGTESVATYPEDDDQGIERPTDLAMGETVADRYTVLSTLGRGGYASVYLARDETAGANVALKVLRVDRLNPVALKRMSREADTARAFQHDRLVRVLDFGRFGDNAFLAMEPVLGQTLRDRMRAGAVSADQAISVVTDVLEGLAALHAHGIVHRDVKPSNILLDHEGRAKLADFGLVTAWADDQSRATQSRAIVGTVEYVSPEQALGEPLDGRSDLYSLGVVLYEMLSGAPLHGARSSLGMLVAHLTKPAPDVRTSRENIPEWLARVTARLLEKDRGARYSTAETALSDMRMRTPPKGPSAPAPPATRISVWALVAALALSLLALAAWRGRPASKLPVPLVTADVKGGILRGLDDRGNVLWAHSFNQPLNDANFTVPTLAIVPRLRVADLEGDGRNEVLITVPTQRDDLLRLVVFESDGRVRYERKPGRRFVFADNRAYEGFTAHSTHFYVDRSGRRRLFLLSSHRPEFPSILEELDPQGHVVSEYVASGVQVAVSRHEFRGHDALALSGYHNETRGGSVTFLSLDYPVGHAPSMLPEFACVSCPQGDPLAIVVVPRSDVVAPVVGKQGSATTMNVLTIDDGKIDFSSRHGESFVDVDGQERSATVSYTFTRDLQQLLDVRPSELLRAVHNRLFKDGRLDHSFGDHDVADLHRVVTWDGRRWAPLPMR